MNHVYRLVWSKVRNMLVAVAETAGSRSKGGTPRAPRRIRAMLALLLMLGAPLAEARVAVGSVDQGQLAPAGVRAALVSVQPVVPNTAAPTVAAPLPTNGQVVAGQASLSQSGNTLTVNQSTASAILNWQSFSIANGYTVNFKQPGASSVALNRVLGSDPSAIFGHLNANGQVFLTNANGVYFAPGAEVHVGGLVASTLGISNADFLSGNYHFSGSSTASVKNAGSISAEQGGYVAFIGNTVDNSGSVRTPGGTTALGAGAGVDLTLAGNQLVAFKVSGAALNALAANGGVIQADGGKVILSAQAKDALLQTVVNNSGQIRAQTIANHNGVIELLGGDSGTVQVAGTLDASAPQGGNGGQIETSGAHVKVANGAVITTKASAGQDGNWLIDPNDFTIAASGGDITGAALSTDLASGGVTIQTTSTGVSCTGATCLTGTAGSGDINVNDAVTWSANTLTLNAYRDININTAMNGSGTAGLALQYGQGSTNGVIGTVASTYNVYASVNLASTGSFSTQMGSTGSAVSYTILTSLGSSNSTTKTDLQGINGNLSGHYVLGTTIDASATSSWNSGAGFAPLGSNSNHAFSGIFDGLGHSITSLSINRSGTNEVGLFGNVNGGTLRNVGLVGGSVSGAGYVGGLVGLNGGTISDAYATGSVSGSTYVGGLVGYNASGTISDAYATGSVSGSVSGSGSGSNSNSVGGLVGYNANGTISDAYATGSVSGSVNGSDVGGLVGYNNYGTISDAYATGSVSGRTTVGGLVGSNLHGTISDAYATGSVSGSNDVGGLVGFNGNGTISAAYATGSVSGNNDVGGLVGFNGNSTISAAYWDTTTATASGLQGIGNTNNANVTGLSTAALAAALPTGFTSSVWGNGDNQTTPYLLANASFGTVSGSVILGSTNGVANTSATPVHYGVILNVNQLQNINSTGLGLDYVLGNNINASATSGWNGGAGFAPLGNSNAPFTGVFDGLGHIVSDLTINRPSSSDVGLFGAVRGGTLRNVGLVGGSVSGSLAVGGLVGSNSNGTISDAYATGSVSGYGYVGGLVGHNSISTISDAYATGSVSGGSGDVGGLVGYNSKSTISDAYATGNVSSGGNVGGLVGINLNGMISDAYATGGVSGSGAVGGLVGENNGTISDAYATGGVSGRLGVGSSIGVGGLVGSNVKGTISDAYATGSVSGGGDVGGLAGKNSNSTISDAYATGSVSGSNGVGGLVGSNEGTIREAYASGSVSGNSVDVGGLVGLNDSGTINDAYATGSVSGSSSVGGLVGMDGAGMISDAYATGSVSGSGNNVGGLVGFDSSGTIIDGYWDTTTGLATGIGGYSSNNRGTASGAGLSTSALAAALPTGFTTSIWGNGGNQTTPYLLANASFGTVSGEVILGSTNGAVNTSATPVHYGVILNVNQLQNINSTGLAGDYVLGTNVDASATSTWNSGAGFAPLGSSSINAFTGVFDGLGYTVSNLSINRPSTSYVGLFGYVHSGTLRNVGLVGDNVSGLSAVGGLVGANYSGTISGAYVTGVVSGGNNGNFVGGLVGQNNAGTISDAYAVVKVSGSGSNIGTGGLVGANSNGTVSDAYATGSVNGNSNVGGLAGSNNGGAISDSYATGTVIGGRAVGGLVGSNHHGTIAYAYATGSVTGSAGAAGGLVGYNSVSTVSNSYATGSVGGGTFIGGLVGWNSNATISDAYATGSVISSGIVGGLVGYNSNVGKITNGYWDTTTTGKGTNQGIGSNSGGTVTGGGGLTTAQLAAALPTGFTTSVWGNGDNQTTPYLLANASFGTVSGSVLLGSENGVANTSATPTHYGVILTLNQLQNINSTGLAGDYVLGGNIDASATATWNSDGAATPTYAGFAPIGNSSNNAFSGIFDGLGHTIASLSINRSGGSNVGLFGYVDGGTLRNVGLVGGSVSGSGNVGGLVGFNYEGSINNAYATGSVSDTRGVGSNSNNSVGGLVGVNYGVTITGVYASGSVSGSGNVGGLVGNNLLGSINNAYATGSVTGSGNSGVGGLVGVNRGITISNAYATGSVSSSGSNAVGGLVGTNNYGTISDAYATGSVSGNGYVGGLVGYNSSGTITDGYWDTTTGLSTGIGSSNGGTVTGGGGLTTVQLAAVLPTGFTTSNWGNGDNQTTPYLLANASFGTVSGSVILGSENGVANTSVTPTHYGVILTLNQLQNINSTGLAGDYVLGSNIDASATSGWNGGAGFAPLGNSSNNFFSGIFDGLGHTIASLSINRSGSSNVGLFGYVRGGTLRNVGLVGGSVSGFSGVGGLVGANSNGTISDAYATGSVTGSSYVGGLVGVNAYGTISDAYATGSVTGTGHGHHSSNTVGGLVGVNAYGTISDTYATGSVSDSVSDSVSGFSGVGGLVGVNYGGTITGAYASGSVSGSGSGSVHVGGLVGFNYLGSTNNAYATGSVTGSVTGSFTGSNYNSGVGGLVGANDGGRISNAYATGSVSGSSYVGGLVGVNGGGTISNAYATGSVNGTSNVGGLVGADFNGTIISNAYWDTTTTGKGTNQGIGSHNGGTVTGGGGLTDAAMMQQANFVGFDFSNVWVIYAGHTAPLLRSFMTALTVTSANQTQTYNGGTFTLSSPTYSLAGASTSGHLFGLGDPYNGAKNVGTYGTDPNNTNLWSDQQGYIINQSGIGTLTITPLALNGSIAAGSSIYGNTLAPGAVTFTNLVTGDKVGATVTLDTTGHLSGSGNLNAGNYSGIETAGALTGADASNYSFGTITAGNYDVSALALNGSIAAGSSTYGSALAPGAVSFTNLVSGDSVGATATVDTTGHLSSSGHLDAGNYSGIESAGTLSGTDAANYSIGTITAGDYDVAQLALTITGLSGSNKIYDGNTDANATANLAGVFSGDAVSDTLAASFADKNVGTGKTVTVNGITLSGADAGNYDVAIGTNTTTADISKASLTLANLSASNKVYDATTAASATATLAGVFSGDTLNDSLTASFNNKNVGTGKTITVNGVTLSGADAGNYDVAIGSTTTADISKAALTLAGLSASNKVYDATTDADATATLAGVFSGDTVNDSLTANFDNKNVGTGKTVTVNGITLSGVDAGNYDVAIGDTTTANISQASLTLSGL
ncbi:MAG: GLUG motif-containing protein, partial [Rhodanobacter sp.]